jgi:hypothetical protein
MTVVEHARRSTRFAARDDPAGVAALSALLEDVA